MPSTTITEALSDLRTRGVKPMTTIALIEAPFTAVTEDGIIVLCMQDTAGFVDRPFYAHGERVLLRDRQGNQCEAELAAYWTHDNPGDAPSGWFARPDWTTWQDAPDALEDE